MRCLISFCRGLVANPALQHFVLVKLDTDHSLVTAAIKGFVATVLQRIVSALSHTGLDSIAKVGSVLGMVLAGQFNDNGLVVNNSPRSDLASLSTLSRSKNFHCVISLQFQVKLAGLTGQCEF